MALKKIYNVSEKSTRKKKSKNAGVNNSKNIIQRGN